jgi:hypothetical protein
MLLFLALDEGRRFSTSGSSFSNRFELLDFESLAGGFEAFKTGRPDVAENTPERLCSG